MTLKNPAMLQAIGRVAVQAALFEQQLHVAYWRYAGLSIKAGQVITERINPKRVLEDIIKIVGTEFKDDDPLRAPKAIKPRQRALPISRTLPRSTEDYHSSATRLCIGSGNPMRPMTSTSYLRLGTCAAWNLSPSHTQTSRSTRSRTISRN